MLYLVWITFLVAFWTGMIYVAAKGYTYEDLKAKVFRKEEKHVTWIDAD